jgi:FHA domain-containing protein
MAGPLSAVERFFERLFERPAARLFQTKVEVVQIQRTLERVMESERRVHARRSYAPTTFRVLLNDADAAALDGDLRTLPTQLAEALRVYARSHGYVLLAQPHVEIGSSSAIPPNDVRAFAEPIVVPANGNGSAGAFRPAPQVVPRPSAPPDLVGEPTAVFAAPRASAPQAQLAVRAPGHQLTRIPVRVGTLRLGRSLDNDIVLADDKVSRHHGQISIRLGMLVYADLGSTNGSLLNGSKVTEIALGPGDVLQLGSSTVTIEPTS